MVLSLPVHLLVFLIGGFLHFLHPSRTEDHRLKILDVFSAVNESTWEHMKIFTVASFLTTVFYLGPYNGFFGDVLLSSSIAVSLSVFVIPTLFYGYKLFIRNNVLLFDIGIFFATSYIFAFLQDYFTPVSIRLPTMTITMLGILLWSFIWIILSYWTYSPPRHPLFKCPKGNCYGHPKPKARKKKRRKSHIV